MKLQKIFKIALIIFLIIQPLFDLKIFYNSISTLIRVIVIGIIFLYYFITSKNNKKYFLLIYPALIGIYFVFHHANAMNFTSLVPGNFNYSILKEGLYFVKMISPFLLLYSLIKASLKKEEIFLVTKSIVFFMSMIIIVSNIFCFSYGSYSDEPIKANIFSWFTNNGEYTYQDLASKGLFEYANQIGAVLIMFLPFVIYSAFKEKTFTNITILFANILALLLLCTKVSVFGIAVVMAYTLCIYLFKKIFIDKQKLKIDFWENQFLAISMIIFYISIAMFNPTFARMNEAKEVSARVAQLQENIVKDVEENVGVILTGDPQKHKVQENKVENKDFKIQFIEENYKKNEINEKFIIERYPYVYDKDFWYEIISLDNPNKMHYRFLEEKIVKRVIEINNNPYDKWLRNYKYKTTKYI